MKIKLRNRLEVLMKDSGISTFEEMSKRLRDNQSVDITRTSISRKFRDDDVTLSLSLTEAICNELQCLPGDFFETELTEATPEYMAEVGSRLQPFRYGTVRMKASKEAPTVEAVAPAAKAEATTVRRDNKVVNLDDVLGPRVTHMSADKLKK
ncbi:MAG: helix-turn-helix transcriptional regulator [Pseudomonadota bacterium]